MFILEVHSSSLLSIFKAKTNLSDAYKKVHVVFVVRLSINKKFSLRKQTFSVRKFYELAFSHRRIPLPNEESFYPE